MQLENLKIKYEDDQAFVNLEENMAYLVARYPSTPEPDLPGLLLALCSDYLQDYGYVGIQNSKVFHFEKVQ